MCVYNCYASIYYYLFERYLNQDLGLRGTVQGMLPGLGITSAKFLEGSQMQLLLGRENIMCKDRNLRQRRDGTERKRSALRSGWGLGTRARVGVSVEARGGSRPTLEVYISLARNGKPSQVFRQRNDQASVVFGNMILGLVWKTVWWGLKQHHKEPVPGPWIRAGKWVTSAGWRWCDLEWEAGSGKDKDRMGDNSQKPCCLDTQAPFRNGEHTEAEGLASPSVRAQREERQSEVSSSLRTRVKLRKGILAGNRSRHMELTSLFKHYVKSHLIFPHVIMS